MISKALMRDGFLADENAPPTTYAPQLSSLATLLNKSAPAPVGQLLLPSTPTPPINGLHIHELEKLFAPTAPHYPTPDPIIMLHILHPSELNHLLQNQKLMKIHCLKQLLKQELQQRIEVF